MRDCDVVYSLSVAICAMAEARRNSEVGEEWADLAKQADLISDRMGDKQGGKVKDDLSLVMETSLLLGDAIMYDNSGTGAMLPGFLVKPEEE